MECKNCILHVGSPLVAYIINLKLRSMVKPVKFSVAKLNQTQCEEIVVRRVKAATKTLFILYLTSPNSTHSFTAATIPQSSSIVLYKTKVSYFWGSHFGLSLFGRCTLIQGNRTTYTKFAQFAMPPTLCTPPLLLLNKFLFWYIELFT